MDTYGVGEAVGGGESLGSRDSGVWERRLRGGEFERRITARFRLWKRRKCGPERRVRVGLPEFEQTTPHGVKHRAVDGSLSEGCQRTKLRGQGEDV